MPLAMWLARRAFGWTGAAAGARSAAQGSERLRAIVSQHVDAIYGTARRLGIPARDIEDVVQEVLVVVVRRQDDIEAERERAFVVGATVRVVANLRRRFRRHPEDASDDVGERLQVGVDPELGTGHGEAAVERSRLLAILHVSLDAMTEPQRVAFVLFELEEWTAKEVARELGVSEGTVVSRVRRAREVFWAFRELYSSGAPPCDVVQRGGAR
jgi:RNA polymerase sigma-70 factor, ECF subfamily